MSWRAKLLKYNDNQKPNPLCLMPAYQLYESKLYGALVDRFGIGNDQTELAKVILDGAGTIDNITADGVTAYWGPPIAADTHADDACDAANALVHLGEHMEPFIRPEMPYIPRVQVVITTTSVMAGNLGPEQSPRYSIFGDYVLLLDSLEQLARDYGNDSELILLTDSTQKKLRKHHARLLRNDIILKGRKEKMSLYALEHA